MKQSFLKLLPFALVIMSSVAAYSADNFVKITLPKGISVELPRNWTALSRNLRITLDSTVQSVTEQIGVFDASSDLNFAANYFEDNGKTAAIFNIRYYPDLKLSQQDAAQSTPNDVRDINALIRANVEKGGKAFGASVIEWRGTKLQQINGATAFVSEYTRTPIENDGEFCSRLVRIFRKQDSYTITVSYRLSQERLLRPICDRIITSIRNQSTIVLTDHPIPAEGVTLALPSPPKVQQKKFPGGEIINYQAVAELTSERSVLLSFRILKLTKPALTSDTEKLLSNYLTGYLGTFYQDARVVKKSPRKTSRLIEGHYFRVQALSSGKNAYTENFFFVQRGRMWHLSLLYGDEIEEATSSLFDAFINSFRFD